MALSQADDGTPSSGIHVNSGTATPHRVQQTATLMLNSVPANTVAPQQQSLVAAPFLQTAGLSGLSSVAQSNSELLAAFECPVCMEYMLPPYLQCQSGHLLCGNCRPKVHVCPACRGPVPNIRNLAMDKIASTLMFPCKYTGCLEVFSHLTKADHEEHCDFRPYSCPCPGASCKWQGSLNDVMPHLFKQHKTITTLQGEDIVFLATDIKLPGAVDWVMMQSCFNNYFMLVLEKQDKPDPSGQSSQQFYAVVQLIGTRNEAENFIYKLELSNGRRRLCWEATPRSIHEGVNVAISQSDCLAFDAKSALLFAENGNLGINVTIQKTSENIA
ncbi:E3 ubiquitin-protein ligase [Aphelenchoides besseyi]|nr:E3 ubiquitin-protein ligase [Aphelenchoides besseyi]